MKNHWWSFIVVKILAVALLVGLGSVVFLNDKNMAFSSETTKSEKGPTWDLPKIPEGNIALAEASAIRQQLLIVKRDVESKIQALALTKASLEKTRKEVTGELKMLAEQKQLMEETLQNEKKVKEDRVKEALVFIEKMEPKKAAPLMEAMDRDLVIALFKRLPPRNVTRILENVSARKATELMEYYTRIRSGREYELLQELGLCQVQSSESEKSSGSANDVLAEVPAHDVTPAPQPNL